MWLVSTFSFYCKIFIVLCLQLMTYGKKIQSVKETDSLVVKSTCTGHIDCPPWGECSNNRCVCKEELNQYYSVRCNNETLQLSVIKFHCVTFDNNTKDLFEGSCIENHHRHYRSLPINTTKLNQFMCEERWNRTGRLCGKCLPGHSPLAYSYNMRCVKCPEGNKNIWKYILVAFGPLTIFYFIVLFFKVKITSSHLHGYLIFSQIISTPIFIRNEIEYEEHHSRSFKRINALIGLYSLWNLDFFRGPYPNICLDMSTLTVISLDYAVAIYPLLLTVVSYFLIQLHARNFRIVVILWKPFRYFLRLFCRNWDSRTTVIDAYVTFFVLSFVKITSTTIDLLIPVRVYSLNNGSVTWALYNDGAVDYFGREHLPYAILAIACTAILTAPIIFLLLFYQLKCFQRLLTCLKIHSQLLHAVTDSFQGCYKNGMEPGTRDYRWFAAVPLIGRIVFLLIYSITLDTSILPFLTIFILSIMFITTITQPYKTNLSRYTKLDITFWGFLAAFCVTNITIDYGTYMQQKIGWATRTTVGVLPLLYMIGISVYWILSRMRKIKHFIRQIQARRRGYLNIEETLPDRLVNPEHYQERDLQELPKDNTRHSNDTY